MSRALLSLLLQGEQEAPKAKRAASRKFHSEQKEEASRRRKKYQRSPEGLRRKFARALAVYGLTPEAYSALLEKQKGACAICLSLPPEGKRLSIDHCHRTGAVRGLLCHHCNLALGSFKENFTILKNALAYVVCDCEPLLAKLHEKSD